MEMDYRLASLLRSIELKHFVDEVFKSLRMEYDLKKIEFEVLYALSSVENCTTPSEIADQLKLNRGHVSQAIDTLYKRKLIEAVQDENDRRYIHYYLTEEGTAIKDSVYKKYFELSDRLLDGISADELELFEKVNNKIYHNIQKYIEE